MDMRIVAAIIAVILSIAAICAWASARKRRRLLLRERFGPEFDRVVKQYGEPRHADSAMETPEGRVQELEILPLSQYAREQYARHWLEVQRQFVDDPRSAVAEADDLVSDVMSARVPDGRV